MNGAQSLVSTLVANDVDVCFANPGTSEMHFLAALDDPRMKSVLCLFEGVCTGAADGFYRMTDRPASTLLHLGPGLSNGLANIHNARRASSGMVNIVGEHSVSHLKYDPPLKSDIAGLARPLSHWVRQSDASTSIAWDAATAVSVAKEHPGKIATLILPGNTAWEDAGNPTPPTMVPHAKVEPSAAHIDAVAKILRSGEPTMLILAGKAARADTIELAFKVAAKTGCRIASQFFTARMERGAGRVPLERIPYAVAQARAFLADVRHIVTLETREPVAFFSYPDQPSLMKAPGAQVHTLSEADEDSHRALEMLVEALKAKSSLPPYQSAADASIPIGDLNPISIAHALCAAIPENGIVVDESLTSGRESMSHTLGAKPHDMINNLGGSIGYSPPLSTGAAYACRDRRTLCLVGDGSAMYTIQALWTQARESLPVTTIVFANNSYNILKGEYANMGAGEAPGVNALSMIDIDRPTIDWLAMGKSMGVPGVQVADAEQLALAILKANDAEGPVLIEVKLY